MNSVNLMCSHYSVQHESSYAFLAPGLVSLPVLLLARGAFVRLRGREALFASAVDKCERLGIHS